MRGDGNGVELVEGEAPAEMDPSVQVAAPSTALPGEVNLALDGTMGDGPVVAVSSIIWGHSHLKCRQKLRNVLRPGARYGAPRFQQTREDCSFIFAENDPQQWLLLDLGAVFSLSRVGASGYQDRWLSRFDVITCLEAELPQGTSYPDEGCFVAASPGECPQLEGNMVHWGCWHPADDMHYSTARRLAVTRPFCFDAPDGRLVDARYVLFRVASGHYYGAGARLGPLFVWGSPGWWTPETHAAFPPIFHEVLLLIQLVSRAPVPTGDEEHGFAKLPRHVLRHILSFLRISDWTVALAPPQPKCSDARCIGM